MHSNIHKFRILISLQFQDFFITRIKSRKLPLKIKATIRDVFLYYLLVAITSVSYARNVSLKKKEDKNKKKQNYSYNRYFMPSLHENCGIRLISQRVKSFVVERETAAAGSPQLLSFLQINRDKQLHFISIL